MIHISTLEEMDPEFKVTFPASILKKYWTALINKQIEQNNKRLTIINEQTSDEDALIRLRDVNKRNSLLNEFQDFINTITK